MISIGNCARCEVYIKEKPGLGYADYRGYFSYCDNCLKETQIGDRYRKSGCKPIWLEDILPNCILESHADFYLGKAKTNWNKLKNIKCGCKKKCSPHKLKTTGCPNPKPR